MQERERDVQIPWSYETCAQLSVVGGMSDFRLESVIEEDGGPSLLVKAHMEGRVPRVDVRDGQVQMVYGGWFGWLRSTQADVALSRRATWSLEVRGGARGVRAHLTDLSVSALHIHGGASDVLLELGATSARVPIVIHGGAERLTVVRPRNVAVKLQAFGGAAAVHFDELSLETVGGGCHFQSHGDLTEGHYALTIHGGVSRLVVASTTKGLALTRPPVASEARESA